jgi:site-specific recombinase XerC
MSSLAPTLQAYFTDRLLSQRRVSPNTIASYRDTFRLLLAFAQEKTGTPPARLEISDLDAPLIGSFLEHLEAERGNSVRTVASNCTSCRCDLGLRDVSGVRDALTAFLLDVRWERDAVAVGAAVAGSELAG